MNKKTAILIFANSAEKELMSTSSASADFFELLNTETVKTVKKTGLPYFHCSEKEQTGNTFGERFTNAIDVIYNKGFKQVITLGNDIPHLTANHILKAKDQLNHSDVVLGPSTDGGFYLMGFKQTHFNTTKIQNLPWQTTQLRHCLNTELQQQQIKTTYLETLSDIDDASDFEIILESFKPLDFKIKKLLLKLRYTIQIWSSFTAVCHDKTIFKKHYNKGSPILLHI
ncbi:TIGR04282 family arsenosugar biosynthesis glycosyltransferase [Winogradskyella sediminis]|uniref:TIGR04282 family arsenosugar biosynthesis glycosyltransferase n=1 Tax=Winogradskyella sediminis TaxID=1382466 RepID=UPI003AA818A4